VAESREEIVALCNESFFRMWRLYPAARGLLARRDDQLPDPVNSRTPHLPITRDHMAKAETRPRDPVPG
jgi:hypothetical protein